MRRFGPSVACVAFVAVLWLPLVERATGWFPVSPLAGVETRETKVPATLRAWLDGAFQSSFDSDFSARIGFRPWFVRTYNQIGFSLFRRVAGRRGTQIVIGRSGWLYERDYVHALFRRPRATAVALDSMARKVRALQDALRERGIALLVLVSPSKARVYPEFLPEAGDPDAPSDYQATVAALDRAGVRVLDASRRFRELKPRESYPLFPPGGTHWSYYGLSRVLPELCVMLGDDMRRPFPAWAVERIHERRPVGSDSDLLWLLNIWAWRAKAPLAPYPVLRRQAVPNGAAHPRLLVVGDSFALTLIDLLMGRWCADKTPDPEAGRLCEAIDLLYYNRTLQRYPGGASRPFQGGARELRNLLQDKDAVILEVNEIWLPRVDFGFVKTALEALEA